MNIRSDMSEWEQIPPIRLDVSGDLQVEGWEQRALEAQTDDEDPHVALDPSDISIATDGNLMIRLPVGSRLLLEVSGDANVQRVRGEVQIERVGGDLNLIEATMIEIKGVGGDLHVRQASRLSCKAIGGDAVIEQVMGTVVVNAGGDLHVRESRGDIVANAQGDAHLQILATAPQVKLNAQGDVHCELGEGVGASVKVVCGGELSVHSKTGHTHANGRGVHSLSVGTGDGVLAMVAQGDVTITGAESIGEVRSVSRGPSSADDPFDRLGEEMGRLGEELGRMGEELGLEFGNLGLRIAEKINHKLRRNLERERHKAARATARAAAKSGWTFGLDIPEPPRPPRPPAGAEQNEPVTEEERMMILRMVEEGKISADEAEKLLAALEGDYEA